MQPRVCVRPLTIFLGLTALLLASGQPSFGQPAPICTDFNNGNADNWKPENATATFPAEGDRRGYILLADDSGASNLSAPQNLLGDLAGRLECGQFCFDVNLFANAPGVPPQPATIFLQGANGSTASFVGNQNILPGSGWHTLCAPIREVGAGEGPLASADGAWSTGSTWNPTTWNTLIHNVTALKLKVDWGTPLQDERVGYDNLCFRPGVCPRAGFNFTPVCAGTAMLLTNTSTGTNSTTTYAWTINGGNPATSTAQNPTSIFANPGAQQVKLCLNGGTAAPLCLTQAVTIHPRPPAPVINGPMLTCNSPATYCVNPEVTGVSYSWSAGNGTVVGSATGRCVQVNWTNPQQGGSVTAVATNPQGCITRSVFEVRPCTSWLADCCRCNELSVQDEKLNGSTFTAALTTSPGQVTRVAVDLISTSVVPFGKSCGSPGSRDSFILGGSLPTTTALLPVAPASREILFTYNSPTALSAAPLSLNLQLPPVGGHWWCGDSLSLCLKYSFTGRDCKTCELIECYGPFRRGGIIFDHDVNLDRITANVAFGLRLAIPPAGEGERPPTGKATLRLQPGSGNPAAKLTGRVRGEIAAGSVAFSDLSIDRAGEGYVLELLIEGTDEPVAASEPFAVSPPPR